MEHWVLLPGLRREPGRLLLRVRAPQVLLHQEGPGHTGGSAGVSSTILGTMDGQTGTPSAL